MRKLHISPFGRTVSSLGSEFIADHEASDSQDVRTGDGLLANRNGWQNFEAAQANFVANYALAFLRGLNSSGATVEEYVTVEDISGTARPYSRHVTTGAPTVIKDGVGDLNLAKSRWNYVKWKDRSYFWNNADSNYPLASHVIGDATSWDPIKNPDDPTVAITLALVRNTSDNTTLNYRTIDYTGFNATTDVAYGGKAEESAITDGTLRVQHTGDGDATVTLTFKGGGTPETATPAGDQDFTNNDAFAFTVTASRYMRWSPSSLVVTMINADGSPDEQPLEMVAFEGPERNGPSKFLVRYPKDKSRALKDNVHRLKFEYNVIFAGGTNSKFTLDFEKITIGAIDPQHWEFSATVFTRTFWSYYWKQDSTGDLTGIVLPAVKADVGRFSGGLVRVNGVNYPLGVVPRLTATNGPSTDKWVLVASRDDDPEAGSLGGPWRIVATYSDAALAQDYTTDLTAFKALDKYDDLAKGGGLKEDEILCAEEHIGHMAWGMKGGKENIMHSKVGSPTVVFNANHADLTDGRPHSFTLSGNEGENPVQMHSVGEVFFILGETGVYAQSGVLPAEMTHIRQVGSFPGTAGINSSAIWQSDDGQPGVAYLSADLTTVNFIAASPIAAGVFDYKPVEISEAARGKIKSFLFASEPTVGDIYVRVDPIADSLWVIYNDKAAIFRKPSQVDGRRHWEYYSYTNSGNWVQWDVNQDYGIRAFRSSGEFDEVEYDNSSNKDPISGANRDGGNAVTGFWESKTFTGPNTRIFFVEADRASLTDTPAIQVTSTRQTVSKTIVSGKRKVRFGSKQQGTEHKFKITLTDNSGVVNRLIVWATGAGQRPSQ